MDLFGTSRIAEIEARIGRPVTPLAPHIQLLLHRIHNSLFLRSNTHVATVSRPSSSEIATSIE